ncbi:uncharacterized protein BYT42DRAFT_220415 [Radiomyces spectabilis]|uniref:uncharacterized protein n=1 Tax=Radiomyces spectabilis TaxID=64574 RepID=UPI0022209E0E|nr:uncharacterized protein BYT42DRAFT_220415 [Radiomyces spectabilis]KAI8388063.1 hypothetical protein BYT42DRAFT_220415 [Radiomyces spectabilis]
MDEFTHYTNWLTETMASSNQQDVQISFRALKIRDAKIQMILNMLLLDLEKNPSRYQKRQKTAEEKGEESKVNVDSLPFDNPRVQWEVYLDRILLWKSIDDVTDILQERDAHAASHNLKRLDVSDLSMENFYSYLKECFDLLPELMKNMRDKLYDDDLYEEQSQRSNQQRPRLSSMDRPGASRSRTQSMKTQSRKSGKRKEIPTNHTRPAAKRTASITSVLGDQISSSVHDTDTMSLHTSSQPRTSMTSSTSTKQNRGSPSISGSNNDSLHTSSRRRTSLTRTTSSMQIRASPGTTTDTTSHHKPPRRQVSFTKFPFAKREIDFSQPRKGKGRAGLSEATRTAVAKVERTTALAGRPTMVRSGSFTKSASSIQKPVVISRDVTTTVIVRKPERLSPTTPRTRLARELGVDDMSHMEMTSPSAIHSIVMTSDGKVADPFSSNINHVSVPTPPSGGRPLFFTPLRAAEPPPALQLNYDMLFNEDGTSLNPGMFQGIDPQKNIFSPEYTGSPSGIPADDAHVNGKTTEENLIAQTMDRKPHIFVASNSPDILRKQRNVPRERIQVEGSRPCLMERLLAAKKEEEQRNLYPPESPGTVRREQERRAQRFEELFIHGTIPYEPLKLPDVNTEDESWDSIDPFA